MKRAYRIISFLICFVVMIATGCSSKVYSVDDGEEVQALLSGKSDFTVTASEDGYSARNQAVEKSDYTIVLPAAYVENEMRAAQEISTFLEKAYGLSFDIKCDDEVTYGSGSKFIAVGKVNFLGSANLGLSYDELGRYGFKIKTVGSSVFVCGAEDAGYGTLNGAYEYLYRQIGFECYAYNEIYYKTGETFRLANLNVTDKPDIPGYLGSSYISSRADYMRRMRTNHRTDVLGRGKTTPYHNMLSWIPSYKYSDHPYWFNNPDNPTQLCLTCRGDEAEYNELLQTAFEVMYNEVRTYDLKIVTWTLMDNYDYCTCDACKAAEKKYGAKSGQLVKFCNDLSAKFKQKYAEEGITDDLSIMFFAYYYYTKPPKAGTIECADNVYPIIAPYNEMDWAASIHSDKNTNIKNIIEDWSNLCKRFGFWLYSVNFGAYLAPADPFSALQENYTYFASKNPVYLFDEGESEQFAQNFPAFTALKEFLSAKLAWKVSSDVSALTDAFFDNYFKDASGIMREYYDKYRMKLEIIFEEMDYTHKLHVSALKQDYFELGTLMNWRDDIERAYKTIEKYKTTDKELYEKLDIRIRTEGLTPNYMILKLYGSYFTNSEYERMVREFYADCEKVCCLAGKEWRPITEQFAL